jgi:uncharacterized protein YceK
MHPYRVKEYLWLLIVVMFILMTLLSGCSSVPQSTKIGSNQYCYTSQTVQTVNKESVTSTTTVKCSDDPVEQYVPAKMGIAKDCAETTIPMNIGGRLVREKMYVCQKHNGVYTVVDSLTMR